MRRLRSRIRTDETYMLPLHHLGPLITLEVILYIIYFDDASEIDRCCVGAAQWWCCSQLGLEQEESPTHQTPTWRSGTTRAFDVCSFGHESQSKDMVSIKVALCLSLC